MKQGAKIWSVNILFYCIAVEKVKSQWGNMRFQYQRENCKVKESSRSDAGAYDIFVPKWAHYKKMRFLSAGAPEAQSELTLETSKKEVVSAHFGGTFFYSGRSNTIQNRYAPLHTRHRPIIDCNKRSNLPLAIP